jgi:hypothetical protein
MGKEIGMEERTCGGRRQKTVLIGTRAVWRRKRREGQGRVEESAKTVLIQWVWRRHMEKEIHKKNMWSNRQKIVMIGTGAVWGRKREEEHGEIDENCSIYTRIYVDQSHFKCGRLS